jgi:hypothetical protein
MKVKELIELLQEMDENREVYYFDTLEFEHKQIGSVRNDIIRSKVDCDFDESVVVLEEDE